MDKNHFYSTLGTKQIPSKNLAVPLPEKVELNSNAQVAMWAKDEKNNFYPVKSVSTSLANGVYEVKSGFSGVYFCKVDLVNETKLVSLSNDVSNSIENIISKFLKNEQLFADHSFLFKKGILVCGSEKSGKTTTIYRVIKSFAENYGIVLQGTHPLLMQKALSYIQTIQDTPVLVNLDNVNLLTSSYDTKSLTDLVDSNPNVIYLASTSDASTLPADLFSVDRFPSVEFIKELTEGDRETYIKEKLPNLDIASIKTWSEKTKGFSIPEINSLIITVLGYDYTIDAAIERIKVVPAVTLSVPVEVVPKKKTLKQFHYDKEGNVVAIVDEEFDDVVKVVRD